MGVAISGMEMLKWPFASVRAVAFVEGTVTVTPSRTSLSSFTVPCSLREVCASSGRLKTRARKGRQNRNLFIIIKLVLTIQNGFPPVAGKGPCIKRNVPGKEYC